ncbi:F-box family protein [Striga asiatica]|uniref:F-box family protein n=1 Tax=Striga asiatica TaxID=4170 RepID=A0A5A7NWZ3_STRAF|nr:F-box family protein [Striga asiatica]
MREMMEMEINGKLRCCTGSDVSKRRRILESADSPQHGAISNTEFLIEVVCRLPIKIVIRCKSISKQWLSLISDPSFARFYNIISLGWQASAFSGSVLRRPPWVFIFNKMSAEGCGMTHFWEEKVMDIMYPFPNSPSPNYCVLPIPKSQQQQGKKGRMYDIQAIHEGLVLYKWNVRKGIDELYICNPMTNQWFRLPRPPKYITNANVSYGFIARVEAGILTSYRVVLVRCYPQKQFFIEFVVFCSESGKWVEYTVHSTRAVQVSYINKTVFLNGQLHWDDCEVGLIAYDPYTSPDEMRLIDFPKDRYRGYYRHTANYNSCGVHQGLIKYFEVVDPYGGLSGFSQLKIWVLEDYDMGGWCLQHMVAYEDIWIAGRWYGRQTGADLVCFDPYDVEIVYLRWCRELVSYDMRTRELRALGLPHEPEKSDKFMLNAFYLCFPLVLPPWPISIPTSLIPKIQGDYQYHC